MLYPYDLTYSFLVYVTINRTAYNCRTVWQVFSDLKNKEKNKIIKCIKLSTNVRYSYMAFI